VPKLPHPFISRSVRPRIKPFALTLYERYRMGRPPEIISRDFGIPAVRVEQRIRAAARYVSTHRRMPEWL
jgi:hypothetical protein